MDAIRKMIFKTVISNMLIIIGAIAGIWGPGASPAFASASGWEVKGQAGISKGESALNALFVSNDIPYLAFIDIGDETMENGFRTKVMQLIDNEWRPLGTPSSDLTTSMSFYVVDGIPHIVVGEYSNGEKPVARVYNVSSEDWLNMGMPMNPSGKVFSVSLFIDEDTYTPYIAYAEEVGEYFNQQITVKKYIGGNWVDVGAPRFSEQFSWFPSLVVHDGTPYVAYQAWSSNITVKKFGTNWVDVGTPMFKAGDLPRLAMDDALYVAFFDDDYGERASVMKFNGSEWVYVGQPGISEGRVNVVDLKVVGGVPYVAYADQGLGGKVTVKKFNGNQWVDVGQHGLSEGEGAYPSLFIIGDKIYLAFSDYENNGRATVMEYVGFPVTYHGNGHTAGSPPAAVPYKSGATVTVPGNTGNLTREGHEFVGWNTAPDGSGTAYTAGSQFVMGNEEVNLYAQWEVNQYQVHYNGNGNDGGTAPASETSDYGSTVTVAGPGNLTKTGYSFDSWNTAADGSGTRYEPGDSFVLGASNVTLYAQWKINQYEVRYNGNGNDGGTVTGSVYADYGSTVTVAGPGNLTKKGYSFDSWNTKQDGTGDRYEPGDTFTLGASNVTLYAQWKVNQYEVRYNGNGNDGGTVTGSVYADYGSTVTVAGPGSLTKEGHRFVDWNTAPDGSGTAYAPGDTFTLGASNVTLYAQWKANHYEVRYHGNGNDGGTAPASVSAAYGSTVMVAGPGSLTKTDYAFDGWNTKADGSGTRYAPGDTFVLGASDVTLYAQWKIAPLSAPINLRATAGDGQVTLQWNTVTGAVYYKIYTGIEPGKYDGSLTKTTTDTTYVVTGLTNGTTYYFVVTAGNTVTESVYSNEVSATPSVTVHPAPGTDSPAANPRTTKVQIFIYTSIAGGETATSIELNRTTDQDGSKIDEMTLSAEKASEIVQKLKAFGSDSAIIVIPDPNDEIKEWKIHIPLTAAEQLADGGVNLELHVPHLRLSIPAESLKGWKEDLRFRIVPVKKEEERRSIERRFHSEMERTRPVEEGDRNIEVLGRPMTVETNLQGRPVILVLPAEISTPNAVQLQDLGIYMEHSDGTKELVPGELVPYGENGQFGIRFTVNKFSTFAVIHIEGWASSQNEEPSSEQRHQAYIRGYDDNTFRPNKALTRAEMAVMLARVFEAESKQPMKSYTDVTSTHWAKEAIDKVTASGWMSGYPDGSFKPDKTLTRAEMASIIDRLLVNAPNVGEGFPDTSGHWAKEAIGRVRAAGIMNGYADGTFRPNQPLTRAEAVVVINKMLGRGPLFGAEPKWSDVPERHWAFAHIQEASIDHAFRKENDDGEVYDPAP